VWAYWQVKRKSLMMAAPPGFSTRVISRPFALAWGSDVLEAGVREHDVEANVGFPPTAD